jgi:hypothetical protein
VIGRDSVFELREVAELRADRELVPDRAEYGGGDRP